MKLNDDGCLFHAKKLRWTTNMRSKEETRCSTIWKSDWQSTTLVFNDPSLLDWTTFERLWSIRCQLAEYRRICWRRKKIKINLEKASLPLDYPRGKSFLNAYTYKAGASQRIENVPKSDAVVKSHKNKRSNTMATNPQSWSSCKNIFLKGKNSFRELLHLQLISLFCLMFYGERKTLAKL